MRERKKRNWQDESTSPDRSRLISWPFIRKLCVPDDSLKLEVPLNKRRLTTKLEHTTPKQCYTEKGAKKEKNKIKGGPLEAQACLSGLTWETFHWPQRQGRSNSNTHTHTQQQQIQNWQRRPIIPHTVRKPLCESHPRTSLGFKPRSYLPPEMQTQTQTKCQSVSLPQLHLDSGLLLCFCGENWKEKWFTALL